MPTELYALAMAALLQVAQYVLFAVPANIELGTGYTSSPRDRPPSKALSVVTARLQRALTNHNEALILFTIAVVVVTLGEQSSAVTRFCAWAYVVARVMYIPAYALGWQPWRSAIWAVGLVSTVIMLGASLT